MVWCEITNSWKPRWGYMRAEKASVSRLRIQNSNSNSAIEQKRRIERLDSSYQAARGPERWSVGKRKERKERASGEERARATQECRAAKGNEQREKTTRQKRAARLVQKSEIQHGQFGQLRRGRRGRKKGENRRKEKIQRAFFERCWRELNINSKKLKLFLERVKTDFGFDVGEESEIQQKRGSRQSSQFWEKESGRKSAETKQPLEIWW